MSGYFEKTSGRAKCRECGKVISKDEIAFKVFGFQDNCKQFHQECAKKIFKNILGEGANNRFSEGGPFNEIEIYTKPATGRAKCVICHNKIKDCDDLVIDYYGVVSHHHVKCFKKDCKVFFD